MRMGNLLPLPTMVNAVMSSKPSLGLAHPTVVPTNFEAPPVERPEPESEHEDAES
jgi:hypothetical protein